LFTTEPEVIEDASLLETARRFPSIVSSVGHRLLQQLESEMFEEALCIIDQVMISNL
jgi:hypothetical protein